MAKILTKLQRKKFFNSLAVIPGYICRHCWKATAIPSGSKEPMCKCTAPKSVPVNTVVILPENWWVKAV